MKTADLIAGLAADTQPVAPRAPGGRLAVATLVGGLLAMAVLLAWLGLRPLNVAVTTQPFWMKAAYTLFLAVGGGLAVERLGRPGASPRTGLVVAGLTVAAMVALGAGQLMHTAPGEMRGVWLSQTWNRCPWRIMALSAPIYLGVVWALRRMAPTRPGLAGAVAGLFAGAVGATVYGLYCEETSAAFVATWYTLGILGSTALGGLVGRRLLRW